MRRFPIMLVAVAALAACHREPPPKPLWQDTMVLGEKPRPVTLKHDGVTVALTPLTRQIQTEDGPQEDSYAGIVVTFPGQPPFAVPASEQRSDHYGVGVGIGRLSRDDDTPAVLLGGYTGGMHCCATADIVTLVDGKPAVLSLEPIDGEPMDRFPVDRDGDGVVDFERTDDTFLYAFTSYNASWAPPQIWNLVGGKLEDVSTAPRYAPLYTRYAAETRAQCEKTAEGGNNGACAAYAAAMARLGKAEEGIKFAAAHAEKSDWLPEPCMVEMVNDQCPAGKTRTFTGFEDALRWFLKDNGYTP